MVTDALRDTLDGSVYGTGTFHGEIAIGGTLLSSKGEDDVFVARRDAAGAVVWALSIGSADEESAPHLALSNGHVSVIAMTTGNVDCGSGALPNYPGTGTFVMCAFDTATGVLVESGAFPVRSP